MTQVSYTLICKTDLIRKYGRTKAQMIQQLHYWLEKTHIGVEHEGKKWIRNTAQEWAIQICVSSRTIERVIKDLVQQGILRVAKLSTYRSNRTNFLTLNYEKLDTLKQSKSSDGTNQTDKVSESNRQNVGMVISKNTNKDLNNKSKKQNSFQKNSNQVQAEQVNDYCKKNQEIENIVQKNLQNNNTHHQSDDIKSKIPQSIHNHTTKPKNTTVQDMLKCWNEMFPKHCGTMNKDLAPVLFAAFKQKCHNNMQHWQNYLMRLKSSDFIMSSTFFSLNWALKFKNMDRIFKGELGVKNIPYERDSNAEHSSATAHIETIKDNETEKCHRARKLFLQKFGVFAYNNWFTKVDLVEHNGIVQLKAHNRYVHDYILQHYNNVFAFSG